jgi:hypothetical protein
VNEDGGCGVVKRLKFNLYPKRARCSRYASIEALLRHADVRHPLHCTNTFSQNPQNAEAEATRQGDIDWVGFGRVESRDVTRHQVGLQVNGGRVERFRHKPLQYPCLQSGLVAWSIPLLSYLSTPVCARIVHKKTRGGAPVISGKGGTTTYPHFADRADQTVRMRTQCGYP